MYVHPRVRSTLAIVHVDIYKPGDNMTTSPDSGRRVQLDQCFEFRAQRPQPANFCFQLVLSKFIDSLIMYPTCEI